MLTTASSHNHEQTVASDTWNIEHNLNVTAPIVDCYVLIDGVYNKIIPLDVVVVDSMTVQILWSENRVGKARIV